MTDFQVIFFNAGGTLIQLKNTTLPILYSQLMSRILKKSFSPEEIFLAFRKAEAWVLSRRIPGALFSDLDQRKYQNIFYGQLGIFNRKKINWIEKQIAGKLEMDYVLEKGTKTLLRFLKQKYQLGLISNWDDSLIDILQNLGILDYFDSITLSGDIGISKPDAAIFKSALDDFPEVKPKQTVYIGDEYLNDVVPAQKLKMVAILFDKGPSGMHGRPFQTAVKCSRIKELNQLPEILNKHAIVRK